MTEPTPMTEMSFEITASVLGRTMAGQGLIAEARRSRSEEARLRAELAAKEAECERLLRENLELKMQPVFDEYRP